MDSLATQVSVARVVTQVILDSVAKVDTRVIRDYQDLVDTVVLVDLADIVVLVDSVAILASEVRVVLVVIQGLVDIAASADIQAIRDSQEPAVFRPISPVSVVISFHPQTIFTR